MQHPSPSGSPDDDLADGNSLDDNFLGPTERVIRFLERLNRHRSEVSSSDGAGGWEPSAIEDRAEEALQFPSRRLAVYGTLAPGQINAHNLEGIPGTWREGVVHGWLSPVGWGFTEGFPGMKWDPKGKEISVQVFDSAELPGLWPRLDRFEGPEYLRILLPVSDGGGGFTVANLYAVREPKTTP